MAEKEQFILTEQFNGLQGVTFVKDDCADVDTYYTVDGTVDLLNQLSEENEQLKQRIKSRLHYYRELCNEFDKDDGFTYDIVKRIVEDLEDILK